MDTNTQPESRANAIKKYFGEHFDPYADLADPQQVSRYLAWANGYDAGLAARSPRDEEAVEMEKPVEVYVDELPENRSFAGSVTCIVSATFPDLERAERFKRQLTESPHPVERGTK